MAASWGLTIDCTDPVRLAAFWSAALGYADAPVPAGYADLPAWLTAMGVPEDEWDDGAYLVDPTGAAPTLSLLRVPEAKQVKNRVHVDVKISGGRDRPAELRRERILGEVDRLTGLGGSVQRFDESDGVLDHVVMTDPEGNEFCVV